MFPRILVLCVLLGVLMGGIIEVTDGTTHISLLTINGRFRLESWETAPPEPKGGGTWADNPMASGRRLRSHVWQNVVEKFALKSLDHTEDAVIHNLQDLMRLLEKARQYWETNWQDEPVWIRARGFCETNARYAVITDWRIPELGYPFPFYSLRTADGGAAIDKVSLLLEHEPWRDVAPGEETCVQVSSDLEYPISGETTDSDVLGAGTDDASFINELPAAGLQTGINYVPFGNGYAGINSSDVSGVRFPSVNVPQGAHIVSAFIRFTAGITVAVDKCYAKIRIRQTDNAATFSTLADFNSRVWGSKFVNWGNAPDGDGIPDWTINLTYDTPELRRLVQDIVNRPGWVANNGMAFRFDDFSSDAFAYRTGWSWNWDPAKAPVLYITYTTTLEHFGRVATCHNEVYVANKQNMAQLTHVYWYDATGGGAWSANLIGAATPFDLYPNPIGAGDIIYFGVSTAVVNRGPFESLVFDILNSAVRSGAATITWQYSQGGGVWATLPVQDNTNDGTLPFTEAGVNSVHWDPPTQWATDTVHGVTAWWVRALVTLPAPPADAITTPVQDNRNVYTAITAFAEIDETQVLGDVPARGHLLLSNWSDHGGMGPTNVQAYTNRVIAGLRSLSRGTDFCPYVNLNTSAQAQNPPGIHVGIYGAAGMSALAHNDAPSGSILVYQPAGVEAMADRWRVDFSPAIAPQYYGTYRVLLRGWQSHDHLGDIGLRLCLRFGAGVYEVETWRSETVYPPDLLGAFEVIDLGQVTLPANISRLEAAEQMSLVMQASAADATPHFQFVDLILMPVDEWSADLIDQDENHHGWIGTDAAWGPRSWRRYLDYDAITRPKDPARTVVKRITTAQVVAPTWQAIGGEPLLLQANADQRLWFFCAQYDPGSGSGGFWWAPTFLCHSVQLFDVAQYLLARGAR